MTILLQSWSSRWAFVAVHILLIVVAVVLVIWWRRRRTKRLLEACNLPTVLWRPRFINYKPNNNDNGNIQNPKTMTSSSITGILPRMERLGGPFGMYGTVYGISTPVVHVAHPIPARNILMGPVPQGDPHHSKLRRSSLLSSSCGATKAPAYNHFKNFSGNGVFTTDGDDWRDKRASVMHCLLRGITNPRSEGSQRLDKEANYAAESFIAEIELLQSKRVDDSEDVIANVVPMLQRATIALIYRYITHDIEVADKTSGDANMPLNKGEDSGHKSASSSSSSLCSLATSLTDDSGNNPGNKLAPTGICSPSLLHSYLTSVNDIRMIILAQSRSFWFLLPRWVYRTFSSMYREEELTMNPIRAFAKRACERAKPGSPLALLRERPSHSQQQHGTLSERISQSLLDEAITLLFAGQDTSAATLSWTLHLLSLYPNVQSRVVEEIRTVLDRCNDPTDNESDMNELSSTSTLVSPHVTKQQATKMPFLDAVIKESMRLYPVAPFVVRKLTHNVPVMDGKISTVLPSGAFACVWIYGLHRNKDLWHRPNDFCPDRWIDPKLRALDAGQDMNGAYMPFAAGPRSCLGQPLAHVILRVILSRLLLSYEFTDERQSGNIHPDMLRKDMQAGFTVLPSGGLHLTIRKRQKEQ